MPDEEFQVRDLLRSITADLLSGATQHRTGPDHSEFAGGPPDHAPNLAPSEAYKRIHVAASDGRAANPERTGPNPELSGPNTACIAAVMQGSTPTAERSTPDQWLSRQNPEFSGLNL